MSLNSLLIIASVLVVSATAHFDFFGLFKLDKELTATEDAEDHCIEKAKNGDCEFWNCFEVRFPCPGRAILSDHQYAADYGMRYCNNYREKKSQLNEAGQLFFERAMQCITRKFESIYKQDSIVCYDIEKFGTKEFQKCILEEVEGPDFCDMLKTSNKGVISEILLLPIKRHLDITNAVKILGECGQRFAKEGLRDIVSDILREIGVPRIHG